MQVSKCKGFCFDGVVGEETERATGGQPGENKERRSEAKTEEIMEAEVEEGGHKARRGTRRGGRKKRGRPKGSTAPRHCKRCRQFKGPNAGKCRGRTGRHGASGCEYFDALGAPLTRR